MSHNGPKVLHLRIGTLWCEGASAACGPRDRVPGIRLNRRAHRRAAGGRRTRAANVPSQAMRTLWGLKLPTVACGSTCSIGSLDQRNRRVASGRESRPLSNRSRLCSNPTGCRHILTANAPMHDQRANASAGEVARSRRPLFTPVSARVDLERRLRSTERHRVRTGLPAAGPEAVRLLDGVADEVGACLGIPALTALHAVLMGMVGMVAWPARPGSWLAARAPSGAMSCRWRPGWARHGC